MKPLSQGLGRGWDYTFSAATGTVMVPSICPLPSILLIWLLRIAFHSVAEAAPPRRIKNKTGVRISDHRNPLKKIPARATKLRCLKLLQRLARAQ